MKVFTGFILREAEQEVAGSSTGWLVIVPCEGCPNCSIGDRTYVYSYPQNNVSISIFYNMKFYNLNAFWLIELQFYTEPVDKEQDLILPAKFDNTVCLVFLFLPSTVELEEESNFSGKSVVL